jgi:hypothetical protein
MEDIFWVGDSGSNISGDKTENCLELDYWIVKTDDLEISNGRILLVGHLELMTLSINSANN